MKNVDLMLVSNSCPIGENTRLRAYPLNNEITRRCVNNIAFKNVLENVVWISNFKYLYPTIKAINAKYLFWET